MGSYTGTVPTLLAGELADADKLVEITNFMTAMTAAWTSYTPGWAASAGTPAIGNGTLNGAYRRIGKTLDLQINLIAGSTTTYGTAGAYWLFGLPAGLVAARQFHGSGHMLDAGVAEYQVSWRITAAVDTIEVFRESARATNTSPYTFGTSDAINLNGTIEIT
jgi:hypothetical protein